MHRTRLDTSECPIARALDMIGEWWSLLIVRDALRGLSRFEEFQASLGIARNMLSRRLKALVAAGVLDKVVYAQHPPRYDYRLSEKGNELLPILVGLQLWGTKWAAAEAGPATLMVERTTGQPIAPRLSLTGPPIDAASIGLVAGPGAGAETRAAFTLLREASRRSEQKPGPLRPRRSAGKTRSGPRPATR
jgi:DNA-binding HxlR family transcriptional regulator